MNNQTSLIQPEQVEKVIVLKAAVRAVADRLRKARPGLQPSAFILQPFPDAPIKSSLAQFLHVNKSGL
jgi:hypothetical protein